MGVYIKNMEMPKNCNSCPMCFMRFCQAGDRELNERETRPNAKRPEDCPLVPVPPHGRLGDLDKIERTLHEWESVVWDRNALQMLRDCINLVKATPTIIPAEEATP